MKITIGAIYVSCGLCAAQVVLPDEDCLRPATSRDGRIIAFDGMMKNLVPQDISPLLDVYVHDAGSGRLELVSRTPKGTSGNGPSSAPVVSADGTTIVFMSAASDLVEGDANEAVDLFVFDLPSRRLSRLGIAGEGVNANGDSRSPRMCQAGRFVAFESVASNLVENDSNNAGDVFVHDRTTGTTTRVSVRSTGDEVMMGCTEPDISGDGRFVVFTSFADDLVPGDENGSSDVFLHDRDTRETIAVSVTAKGKTGAGDSRRARISADGGTVVFESWAADLTDGESAPGPDIFAWDRATRRVRCVSRSADGGVALGHSTEPAVSGDGRWIIFCSLAENMDGGPIAGAQNIYAVDSRTAGVPRLVSATLAGSPGKKDSAYPGVSPDGAAFVFASKAPDLVPGVSTSKAVIVVQATLDRAVRRVPCAVSPETADK